MNKKIISMLSVGLSSVLGLGLLVGCGSGEGNAGNGTLVINRVTGEGFVSGTYDEEVRAAIEKKFKEDTGYDLTLKVNLYTEAALNSSIDSMFSSSREQVDGVKHYVVGSGSAVINYAKTKDNALDMSEYVKGSVYEEKLRLNDEKHVVERSGYMNIDGDLKYTVLNDYCKETGWGWAVNKTFWKQAYDAGLTPLNPEDYDAANAVYKNLKISEFEQVMLAIKQVRSGDKDTQIKTPVWAYGWDLVRLFGSLYGASNLSVVSVNYDGQQYYVPPQLAEGYGEFLEWNAHLVSEGIWESANTATNDTTRLNYFVSGLSAVYMAYPDIDQVIKAGRQLEEFTDWEYMICGPLAREDGTVTGFTKREKTFSGLVVPWHSGNAELLVKFLDWMYSDRENYDLCKYGRKGMDWIPTTVTVDGVEYDGWKYPDGKEDEYKAKPPYSMFGSTPGVYCILENVNVSDRVDASYSQQEITYYIRSKYEANGKGFQYYEDKDAYEGIFVGATPSTVTGGETAVVTGWLNGPRSQAWSGMWLDQFDTYLEYYEAWRASVFKSGSKGRTYIDWYDGQVKQNLDFFRDKWGVI